jgi:hypothetical protein
MGDVEFGNGDSVDFVGSLRHSTFDSLLVVVREDRRHGGEVPSRVCVM